MINLTARNTSFTSKGNVCQNLPRTVVNISKTNPKIGGVCVYKPVSSSTQWNVNNFLNQRFGFKISW